MEKTHKAYLTLGIPLGLESFFLILINAVNQILVASLGKEVIAAVAIISQPRMIVYAFARSISYSLSIMISKEIDEDEGIFPAFILPSFVFMGLILVPMFILIRPILIFAGARADYLEMAIVYARWNIGFILFYSLTTIGQSVLISKGHGTFILVSNIFSSLVNIGLCYCLIHGIFISKPMGIVGLGLGGLVSSVINFILTLIYLLAKGYLVFRDLKLFPPMILYEKFKREFNGIFLEQISERLGMFLYAKFAASLGTAQFAAHSIGMNIGDMYWAFAQGMSKASMTLSSELFAKKSKDAFRKLFKFASQVNFILSSLVTLGFYFYGRNLVGIYTKDPEVFGLTLLLIPFIALVSYPEGQAMIGSSSLRALGKAKLVALLYFITTSLIRPFTSLGLICIYGYLGPILALFIDQVLKALTTNYFLLKEIKK